MIAATMLVDFSRRGIRLEPRLHIEAPCGELTSSEREALSLHKLDLLRALLDDRANVTTAEVGVASASISVDSRHPLVMPTVRAKIEAIEHEARRLGWPPELLWNGGFWDSPRGLAAVLDPGDPLLQSVCQAEELEFGVAFADSAHDQSIQ